MFSKWCPLILSELLSTIFKFTHLILVPRKSKYKSESIGIVMELLVKIILLSFINDEW